MDWVFKASSSWELTELERDEFNLLIMENNQNTEEISVDINKWKEQKRSTMASPPPPSSSSKKPTRGPGNEQHVSCLVDGCTADLSSCRDYHRRHRVCEAHSKTPVVVIRGKDQRFCQQCSRFHSVGEFDEVKRSCRKRLDGHNRRRRKPRGTESSMYLNNYGSFFSNHQGTKLLRFGGSPAYTGGPLRWPNREKPSSSKEKKFPFLLGAYSDEPSFLNNTNASSHHERWKQLVEPKANDGALSLLSKHTNTIHHTSNSSINSFNGQHLPLTNLTGPNNHLVGMIHFRSDGFSLENEAPQALSFSWGSCQNL